MTRASKDPRLLQRIRRARELRDRHEQEFVEIVRQAMHERGDHTVKEIAEAAGISRERAYQIRDGRR